MMPISTQKNTDLRTDGRYLITNIRQETSCKGVNEKIRVEMLIDYFRQVYGLDKGLKWKS